MWWHHLRNLSPGINVACPVATDTVVEDFENDMFEIVLMGRCRSHEGVDANEEIGKCTSAAEHEFSIEEEDVLEFRANTRGDVPEH